VVRTSSDSAGIARLQGLAADKGIWDSGSHQGEGLYVKNFRVASLSWKKVIYICIPSPEIYDRGFAWL
jgi:hypothetical protein